MAKVIAKYHITWEGKEHDINLTALARLTGKSTTFLRTKFEQAIDKGIKNPMQWAIEQEPMPRQEMGRRIKNRGVNKRASIDKPICDNEALIKSALYTRRES